MGTDIHGFYQRRPKLQQPKSGFRLSVNKRVDWSLPDYALNVDVLGLGSNVNDWQTFNHDVISDRNYLLFAALADVRNGRGFAGCEIFEPIKPIRSHDTSGLPVDLLFSEHCHTTSPDDPNCHYDDQWLGCHSHQVIPVEELLSYDWHQKLVDYGVFAVEDFLKWMNGDKSVEYCGDVWGKSVVKHPLVDTTDGKAVVFNTKGYTHIPAKWDAGTMADHLSEFLDDLHQITAENPDYDLRLVIGFDS